MSTEKLAIEGGPKAVNAPREGGGSARSRSTSAGR